MKMCSNKTFIYINYIYFYLNIYISYLFILIRVISIESWILDTERCKLIYLRPPQRRVFLDYGSPGPMGLVERDNVQKMIRNDLDRERYSVMGDGGSRREFRAPTRYSTIRIFARRPESAALERKGRGLSWGKHRVTTGGKHRGERTFPCLHTIP